MGFHNDLREDVFVAVGLMALLLMGLVTLAGNLVLGEVPTLAGDLLGHSFLTSHIILGVIGSLLALFSTVITMFYFIGTGKAVKESVREWDLDPRYYDMVLKYKKKYFPTMTLSLVVYIALPSVGAATSADYLSAGFHGMVAYLTVATHAFICYQGWYYIFENDRLVATVDRLAREAERDEKRGRSES